MYAIANFIGRDHRIVGSGDPLGRPYDAVEEGRERPRTKTDPWSRSHSIGFIAMYARAPTTACSDQSILS
jgi:hypothetical protein